MGVPERHRWTLLGAAGALLTTFVAMGEASAPDDPAGRSFIGALGAMTLGAWVYAVATHGDDDEGR